MEAEAAIVSLLTSSSDVNAIIAGRIAQAGMSQGLARPNVIYQRLGTIRQYSNDGPTNTPAARFQITCWADDVASVRALANKVRGVLNGYRGTVGTTDTLKIDAFFIEDEYDAPVQQVPGSDQRIRGVIFIAAVHYRE